MPADNARTAAKRCGATTRHRRQYGDVNGESRLGGKRGSCYFLRNNGDRRRSVCDQSIPHSELIIVLAV